MFLSLDFSPLPTPTACSYHSLPISIFQPVQTATNTLSPSSVGDSKTLAIHPWTTTHEQLSDSEKTDSGVTEDLIRISVGTEHIDDIIADFEQSFSKSKATTTEKAEGQEQNGVVGKEGKDTEAQGAVSGAT